MISKEKLKKINNYLWEIPNSFRSDMRVPARFYIDKKMLNQIFKDRSLEQLVNMATLPGIFRYSLAMPDVHEGYGFPIGGVAAFDFEKGIISPGGVGYDINCGVRLLTSKLFYPEVKPYLVDLANQIQRDVPSGVGQGGTIKLNRKKIDEVLEGGAKRVIEFGFGIKEDLDKIEARGCLESADASKISDRAKKRGADQLGTLGSGNHFLEIQKVVEIYEPIVAEIFGLKKNLITVMIHTGSRGLGHQVCTDYVRIMDTKIPKWGIKLPDRELACAPMNTPEGKDYFSAMCSAANYAWANRQVITHLTRNAWEKVLRGRVKNLELKLLYDVAHNIAKIENHFGKRLVVHRKGATRAFPPGHSELIGKYQKAGQPVLIPGSMGTASYVLVGTEKSKDTFYSVCHGAGRRMSRKAAKKQIWGEKLRKGLENKGIIVRCHSTSGLAEEAPLAYKDIDAVVEVVSQAGLARKVAKLNPLAVIKGD